MAHAATALDPRLPAPATPAEGGGCENCGTALLDRYCHAYGQAGEPPPATLRGFLGRVVGDVANLDARWVRSIALLARPGLLTAEYLAGRRIRHTQPLQLYLGAAAAFFFVNAYRPFLSLDPRTGQLVSTLNAVGVSGTVGEATRAMLTARGIAPELFRERFEATVTGYLPAFMVGSILLFALALALFHRGSGRGFLAHAVFALHWSAFYLLLMIVDRVLPADGWGRDVPSMVMAALAAGYLAVALRRVYGQHWAVATAKAVGLFTVYQVLLSLWMLSAIALAFALLL